METHQGNLSAYIGVHPLRYATARVVCGSHRLCDLRAFVVIRSDPLNIEHHHVAVPGLIDQVLNGL
jgi:hypothetical protein